MSDCIHPEGPVFEWNGQQLCMIDLIMQPRSEHLRLIDEFVQRCGVPAKMCDLSPEQEKMAIKLREKYQHYAQKYAPVK